MKKIERLEKINTKLKGIFLRHSKYAFCTKRENIYSLYHPYLKTISFLNEEGYRLFEKFKRSRKIEDALRTYKNELNEENQKIFLEHFSESISVVEELSKKGFLVKEGFDESKFLKEAQRLNFTGPRIGLMYIFPTTTCNFACRYCHIENNMENKNKKNMAIEIAQKGIDLFIKNIEISDDFRKQVIFYGGEPLLNPNLVKFAVEYLRKQEILCVFGKRGIDIQMITNGSLINKEIAMFFKEFKVGVSVSLDGLQEDNDKMRIYPDKKSTFKDVLRGIEILKENSIEVGISCTVGNHNLGKIDDIARFFVEELNIKSLGCNFINDLERGKNPASADIKMVARKIVKLSNYFEEKGVNEDRVMRRWDAFVGKENYLNDCAGCGGQFVLLPDGYIGPCHAFSGSKRYFIPLKEDIDFRNEPIWQEWARRSPFNMPQCYDCNLISICGGGCPYKAMIRYGSIWKVDDDACRSYISSLLELYIWKYYDRMKKLKREIMNEQKKEKRGGPFSIPIIEWV